MPIPAVRRGLWALGFAGLTVAVAALVIPYAASTKIVRDRIALELSAWSGYRVAIGAPPRIQIWPGLDATLTDVAFYSWTDAGSDNPVITADRIEIDMSALAALRGNVAFSEARFVSPTLYLHRSSAGLYLPTLPGGGRLSRAVEDARSLVAENRDKPDASRLPNEKFGEIEFEGGRIVASSDRGEDAVTDLNGRIDWPALDRPGSLTARGIWHSEPVTIDIGAANPLLAFAGGNTPLSIGVKSVPANFSFGGSASLSEAGYFDGTAVFSTPSLPRLLSWSSVNVEIDSDIGPISWEAHASGDRQRVKFDDASLSVNGGIGMGAVDLSLSGNRPVISGTLAFASVDFRSLLSAFLSIDIARLDSENAISDLARRINIDLRLSADRASAGPLALTDVAATAQVNEGFSAFDISEATAFGGTIQAGLRIDRAENDHKAEIRLQATDVDGAALGSAAGMKSLIPSGKGGISLILAGPASRAAFVETATGTISANFGAGNLSGFDLDGFVDRTGKSGFFGLGEVSSGSLPVRFIALEAALANGVATLGKADIVGENESILLSGIVSYAGRGMALSGVVVPTGSEPQSAGGSSIPTFFVGGTWDAPFVSPVPKAPEE